MKTVLLVEDDYSVREYLKQAIAWEENGYCVLGEADNGAEALELVRKELPDIMITDIQMPQMNGVELIHKISEEGYPTKSVVLSFYDDFEYVRDAMKYGAVDYVLKHQLSEENILNILNDIPELEKSENVHTIKEENSLIKRQLRENLNGVKCSAFRKLVEGTKKRTAEVSHVLRQFGMNGDNITFVIAELRLMDLKNTVFKAEGENCDMDILGFSVCNIIEEITQKKGNSMVCTENSLNYWIIFSCDGIGYEMSMERKGYDGLKVAVEKIEEYLEIQSVVGLSKAQSRLEDIGMAFSQGHIALENAYYKGYGQVYFYTGTQFSDNIEDIYGRLAKIFDPSQNHEPIGKSLEHFLDDMGEEQLRPDLFRKVEDYISMNLISVFNNIKKSSGKDMKLQYDLYTNSLTYMECRKKLLGCASFIDELQNELREECYERKEVNDAIKYIRKNYYRSITLDEVSGYVNLSKVYFSQLFKNETGVNFTDFLIQFRIKEAKKLLKNADMKVYEVAEKVGIPDQHYFNRLFKNITGMTPKKFRE